MNFASQLKSIIDEQMTRYDSHGGKGIDAYCPQNLYHPMADGKYLQSLVALYEGELLSKGMLAKKASQAQSRLRESSVEYFEGTRLWGLGFAYKECPGTEPFLITSSIVLSGMHACHKIIGRDESWEQIIKAGHAGLVEWMRRLSGQENGNNIPLFSPDIPALFYNASAYALSTLMSMSPEFPEPEWYGHLGKKMEFLFSLRTPGLGWSYAADNPVIDLLHQCYILNSMRNIVSRDSLEAATLEMIGQFRCQEGFIDSIKILDEHVQPHDGNPTLWIWTLPDFCIQINPKSARLWSLGELLVLLSHLAQTEDLESAKWRQKGHWVAQIIVNRLISADDEESQYPRHVMHAVHGLASYLTVLRQRNKRLNAEKS